MALTLQASLADAALNAGMALPIVVLVLFLSLPAKVPKELRTRIFLLLLATVLMLLLSPALIGGRRVLIPLLPFDHGCTYVLQTPTLRGIFASAIIAALGLPWSPGEEQTLAWPSLGWCRCRVTRGGATEAIVAAMDVPTTALMMLGFMSEPAPTWALSIALILVHAVGSPAVRWAIDFGCPRTAPRRVRAAHERASPIERALVTGSRVIVVVLTVGAVNVFGGTAGCQQWNETAARALPAQNWPAGYDLLQQPYRARMLSVVSINSVIALCLGIMVFGPVAAIAIQLRGVTSRAKEAESRARSDRLQQAAIYVGHHSRGPLNSAMLCLDLLDLDDGSAAAPAGGHRAVASGPPAGADLLAIVSRAGGAPHARLLPGGQLEAGSSFGSDAPLLPAFDTAGVDTAATGGASLPSLELAADGGATAGLTAEPDQAASAAAAAELPSSASLMRDLKTSLEAAKQQLDDLLLWQRLAEPDAMTRASWGRVDAGWAWAIAGHFSGERAAAGVALTITGCGPALCLEAAPADGGGGRGSRGGQPGRAVWVRAAILPPSGRMRAGPRPNVPGAASAPRPAELRIQVRYGGTGFDTTALLTADPFDPFATLEHSRGDVFGASSVGLRLAVVRGVAASLNGEAGVASDGADRGALVWLRVPVWVLPRGQGVPDTGQAAVTPSAGRGRRRRSSLKQRGPRRVSSGVEGGARPAKTLQRKLAWIADDDEVTTRVMASLLRRWGASTQQFSHGGELVSALEAALARVPNGEVDADSVPPGRAESPTVGGSGDGSAASDDGDASVVEGSFSEATPGPAGRSVTVSAMTHHPSELGGTSRDKDGPASRWLAEALTSSRRAGLVLPTLPDVIVLDGNMPVMGGIETLRALRAMRPRCPAGWQPRLLVVTGDGSTAAEAEAVAAGADALLMKPVDPASFHEAILGE
ncbi:hypothetical protein FNF31_03599 [Cafeteria roenbergensis]|uniref:Response regulatory domain-containing protein n=2 Tax=Cafeteria roenbergensis TaxID=33653 RepID=A0A5A8DB66_CAFRO|nr:hypothetical protein FNF31_03599 [Cafeteria roenbergensis]KAA0166387.1 hypothetical protein FNF28_03156 [Cafeteria roenbergensis]